MPSFKTRHRKVILDQSPWLIIEQHAVDLPNGNFVPDWPWIITPDYVNILAQTSEGKFICFRQTKYGLEGLTLAIVGGYVLPSESPLTAAKRELLEETGCEAAEWIDLGHYLVDPNRGVATGHLYLARQARLVMKPDADDVEEQELVQLSRSELEEALIKGEFKVLAWAATIAFALRQI